MDMSSTTSSSPRVDCILSDCDGVIVDSEVIADEVTPGALRVALGRPDLEGIPPGLIGRRLIEVGELPGLLADLARKAVDPGPQPAA